MPLGLPICDPKARIIKSPDVSAPATWPKSPSRNVFIFEAINMAGAALFKEAWTGKELESVAWPKSPLDQRAWDRQDPGRGGGARGSSYGGSIPLPKPKPKPPIEHVLEWYAIEHQELWERNEAAIARLRETTDWLAQKCRDGELVSYWRFQTGGGDLRPMRAAEWNIDDPFSAIVTTGGFKRYCRELKHTGPFEVFVFFEKSQLRDLLARQPDAPLIVDQADLSRLSPYLQLAVHIALQRGYFDKVSCETKDVRKAEIEAVWPKFISDVEPVTSTVEELAKLVAFPNVNAIRQGRSAGQKRKSGGTLKA